MSKILHIGLKSHMPHDSFIQILHHILSMLKHTTTIEGSLATLADIGDVKINARTTLKNVLHVLRLSTDLVRIQKLPKT